MKDDLLDILCCPMCRGDLVLNDAQRKDEEILTGSLDCGGCKRSYPIEDGIPNLLPPDGAED